MRIATGVAVFLASFLGVAAAGAADPAVAQRSLFDDYGTFTAATEDGHGIIRLALWDDYVRYVVPSLPADKHQALLFLLNQANQGGRAVMLRYDAAHGRLDAAADIIEYPLCAIVLDSLRFEPPQPCREEPPKQPISVEAALPLARADMSAGDFDAAQALLTRFGPPADIGAKKLFLRLRAQDEESMAALRARASRESDKAVVGALADYRSLAALEPGDVDHQFDIAGALLDLGAYAEARTAYDAILKRWPDENYRVAVRVGALYRAQGDYEKALQALNDLVAQEGPQDGMKFHYHRGWTLTLLGRFDEAIREFGEGLASQPDYASAYERRACAYADVGQLKEALADVERAARLFDALPGAASIKTIRDDRNETAALRDRLRDALAKGDGGPLTGTCSGPTWEPYEHPRTRSPLLPPEPAASS